MTMSALTKKICFQRRFEEGYVFYDEEYSRWLECNHPDTLPHNESSAFQSASALVCDDDDDSLVDNHSSILILTSSSKSLPAKCSNSHSPSEKENFSNNSATANWICVPLLCTPLQYVQSKIYMSC